MPRYTRQQVRRRQRTAALILAVVALLVVGYCSIGVIRMVTRDDAEPARAASGDASATPVVPDTAPDAAALSQLPAGESLRPGEVLGVDVSAHQGAIDWTRLRASGISVAYLKASEGVGHEDSQFSANWRGTREAGIARGAYHYFTLCSTGAEQAKAFLAIVPPNAGALPPALDLELDGACTERPDADAVQAEVDDFMTTVEKAWGRRVVVYSSHGWRSAYGLPDEVGRPAWLTRHEGRPEGDWAIWQVRFDARIDGVDHDIDLDVVSTEVLSREATISA